MPQRLMSLDALRGFDMFWIIGADSLVHALNDMTHAGAQAGAGSSICGFLAYELDHAAWQGFHFYDLIFPLFVFMAGISIVFSLGKTMEREGRATAIKRILRRGLLLFVLGLIYSGGLSHPWPNMRLMGVLNRIALCYVFAGLLFCFCNVRVLIGLSVGILIGYWGILALAPIRNIQLEKGALKELAEKRGAPDDAKALFYGTADRVTGQYGHGFNVSDHFDFQYLPGRKYDTYFDPEGYLSTFPAIVTCLLGVFAGLLLIHPKLNDPQKVICLVSGGLVLVALGWGWSAELPVIKKIWTSSYVLVAGGYSALLLGTFYLVVDVWKFQKWCQPFVWMGMNSITIYMISALMGDGFDRVSQRLVGGDVNNFLNRVLPGSGDLALAAANLLIAFWIVHFLYRRKVFIRL